MEPGHYTDPLEDALSHGSQRVAQFASLAGAMAQVVMQRRALHDARKAARGDEQATRILDEQERLMHRQARLRGATAHDPQWLAQADLLQAGRAWAGAASYADTDPAAASAMRKCEDRLRMLHPYAMARYDRLREDGMSPLDAMRETAPLFGRAPDVRVGEPAAARRALGADAADEERSRAADLDAAIDLAATPAVDEPTIGLATAHRDTGIADSARARTGADRSAAQLAAESFPHSAADAVRVADMAGTRRATR